MKIRSRDDLKIKVQRSWPVIDRMIKMFGFPAPEILYENKVKRSEWVEAEVDEWLRTVGFPKQRSGRGPWIRNGGA